jgi:hypothetical protein
MTRVIAPCFIRDGLGSCCGIFEITGQCEHFASSSANFAGHHFKALFRARNDRDSL